MRARAVTQENSCSKYFNRNGFLQEVHNSNNDLTPTIEIASHTESQTQCYSIKSKNVKNKSKFYEGPAIQSISLEQTFLKKRAKSVKKRNWLPVSKLSLSNFTKIKTPQIALKNFTKILIYLSIYFSLNSEAVTSKFSDKSKGINHILRNVVKWSDTL